MFGKPFLELGMHAVLIHIQNWQFSIFHFDLLGFKVQYQIPFQFTGEIVFSIFSFGYSDASLLHLRGMPVVIHSIPFVVSLAI